MTHLSRYDFILRVSLAYAIFAATWIFFSDSLLSYFISIEDIIRFSTAKGMVFVLATTGLLTLALQAVPNKSSNNYPEIDQQHFDLSLSDSRYWRVLVVYFFAVTVSLVTLWVRYRLTQLLGDRPFFNVFMLPIILSALLGGLGPGLTATMICSLGINYLGIHPLGSWRIAGNFDGLQWIVLVVNGVLVSLLSGRLIRERLNMEGHARHLKAISDELRDNEFRLRLAQDAARSGHWEWHLQSNSNYWSEEIWALYGILPHSCSPNYQNWVNSIASTDRPRVIEKIETAVAQGTEFEAQWRVAASVEQSPRWLMVRGRPVAVEGRSIEKYVGIVIDITEQKNTELALRESEKRLSMVLAATSDAIWDWDLATGNFYTSQLFYAMTKLPPPEGSQDFSIFLKSIHPDDRQQVTAKIEEHIAGKTENLIFDYRLAQSAESENWLMVRGQIVERDPDGRPLRMLGSLSDISERKRGEQEIVRFSEELEAQVSDRSRKIITLHNLLNEVLENLPFGVVVFNEKRELVLHNQLYASLLSYPPELLARKPVRFADVIRYNFDRGDYPDQIFEDVVDRFVELMNFREPIRFERLQVGGPFLEVCGLPISAGWTLVTYTDISAHKQAAQALETARRVAEVATETKSAFLANMSHEIRTPLNSIIGLSYLLEKANLPGDAGSLAGRIGASGRSLLNLINDILDFSKIEAGQIEIEKAPFCLADVLDNIATIMHINAGKKAIDLIVNPPLSCMEKLLGDALRLEQILINLVSNGIKFTDRGHVELNITELSATKEQITFRFAVRDTGIGISLDRQKVIFDSFIQADVSITRRFGGSGLGLTICRRLIELLGGEIGVSSELGRGSEFWFTLTFARDLGAHPAVKGMHGLLLLIAEANPLSRDALLRISLTLGWTALFVSSGEEVLSQLVEGGDHGQSDVLLLDWSLVKDESLVTVGAISQALGQNSPRPLIIMLAAHNREAFLASPDGRLSNAILLKPFTPSSLYNAVAEARHHFSNPVDFQPPASPGQRLVGLKLLIVDDSDINQDVAMRIFSGEGACVTLAGDGKQAFELLNEHRAEIDIVLMDVQMPVMDGYTATRLIRESKWLRDLPIIALTAGAYKSQEDAALAAGMTDFISKPFDVDKAIEIILKHVHPAEPLRLGKKNVEVPAQGELVDDYPGLDVDRGLLIWDDPVIYCRYLRKFIDDYGHDLSEMDLLEKSSVAAFAHKLLGIAGNLALMELAGVAAEAIQVLRGGGDPATTMAKLQIAFDTACASIARYCPETGESLADQPPSSDPAYLMEVFTSALRAFDSDDPQQIRPILSQLACILPPHHLAPLIRAMENFNFRSGEEALRSLATEYNIQLGQADHDQ